PAARNRLPLAQRPNSGRPARMSSVTSRGSSASQPAGGANMHKRLALVAVLAGALLVVGGCATLDQPSNMGSRLPGPSVPAGGPSGAPGETNPEWPASAR